MYIQFKFYRCSCIIQVEKTMVAYASANAISMTLYWLCNITTIYYYCAINHLHLSSSKEVFVLFLMNL